MPAALRTAARLPLRAESRSSLNRRTVTAAVPQEALAEQERRAAAEASTSGAPAPPRLTAAGTPYVQPGGQWSRFKTYSTFQRTWDIWRFGLVFFFKLWSINQVGG